MSRRATSASTACRVEGLCSSPMATAYGWGRRGRGPGRAEGLVRRISRAQQRHVISLDAQQSRSRPAILRQGELARQKAGLQAGPQSLTGANAVAHTAIGHHVSGHARGLPKVRGRTARHVVVPCSQPSSNTAWVSSEKGWPRRTSLCSRAAHFMPPPAMPRLPALRHTPAPRPLTHRRSAPPPPCRPCRRRCAPSFAGGWCCTRRGRAPG